MNPTPGKLLAQILIDVSAELEKMKQDDSQLKTEELQAYFAEQILEFQAGVSGTKVFRTAFDLLILLLSDYLRFEVAAFQKDSIQMTPEHKAHRQRALQTFVERALISLGEDPQKIAGN